ncbi:zinc finger BED domain-containing protein RICESLEEPER 2-like [Aegilops tauschii subsp. strangulata]|uniref:zinc finger BED domain-containing protein RICESLEEPER 2-like n=1 Tax=Aegilops tauschii subsp. strangulata TaxID=200361 RepID=UPI001ABC22A6|nr:zinc finger BED domain-containing protein RICESLEEPER 1-like [Aegilops tauschii subsp. strangulata]
MDEDAYHVILSDDEDGQEEEVEDVNEAGKQKLTSKVWLEMKKMRMNGQWKEKCNYCHKELASGPRAGTKHLAAHLKICTLKMLKMKGGKTLSQPSLKMNAKEDGNIFLDSYTFDQEVARRELGNMLVLHEYPLSIVDHAGFRKYVTVDHQKKGYMAITAHFIDESWKLRNVIMRFVYVPAPHTTEVICEVLYDSLFQWNIDEKLMTVSVDNCSTNDKAIEMIVGKIGKENLPLEDLMGKATLLDPQYKRHMLTACFAMLHGIEPSSYECVELVDALVARLHSLIEEYEVEIDEYKPCEELISSMKAPAIMNIFNDILAKQSPAAARLQGEIDMYLTDGLVPYTEVFSVLDWWKVAGTRYPTLRKVARDIFAIPVTTVALESAFSTSGRILSIRA